MKRRNVFALSAIVLVILIIVFFIFSNYSKRGKVDFGYSESIKLDSGEKQERPIDSISIHEFSKYCSYYKTEIFLNKVLLGKNKTFIALSTRMAPLEYIQLMKNDSLLKIYLIKESAYDLKYFYSFFARKFNFFIYRTLYSEPKFGNLIMIDIVNKDSVSILNLFNNKNYLKHKLSSD
jgi:hypothetical protein